MLAWWCRWRKGQGVIQQIRTHDKISRRSLTKEHKFPLEVSFHTPLLFPFPFFPTFLFVFIPSIVSSASPLSNFYYLLLSSSCSFFLSTPPFLLLVTCLFIPVHTTTYSQPLLLPLSLSFQSIYIFLFFLHLSILSALLIFFQAFLYWHQFLPFPDLKSLPLLSLSLLFLISLYIYLSLGPAAFPSMFYHPGFFFFPLSLSLFSSSPPLSVFTSVSAFSIYLQVLSVCFKRRAIRPSVSLIIHC